MRLISPLLSRIILEGKQGGFAVLLAKLARFLSFTDECQDTTFSQTKICHVRLNSGSIDDEEI